MRKIHTLLLFAAASLAATAQRTFPTSLPIQQDNVEWQRDVYRVIDLRDGHNAGLGASNIPNLFTILFGMAVEGDVPVYQFLLSGNETFGEQELADIRDILVNNEIPFRVVQGKTIVSEEDIPTTEVTMFYLKEAVAYDKASGTFRTRVRALCPVLEREDDFADRARYPLFWVRYDDAEPMLAAFPVHCDNYNQAHVTSAADYFAAGLYQGDIYKVYNAQGLTLAQYCATDSLLAVEQQKVERQLADVRRSTYDTTASDTLTVKDDARKGATTAVPVIKRPRRVHFLGRKNDNKR